MSDKPDRRQARTKQVLLQALLELIEEKGTDQITVTDISNRADLNRGTFYLHYRDVPDMLEQIKEEAFTRIQALIIALDIRELMEHLNQGKAYPKSVRLFEEFAAHRLFYQVILGPNGDMSFLNRVKDLFRNHMYAKLTYKVEETGRLVPIDYLIAYSISANLGVVQHWIRNGMQQSPEEISLILSGLMNYGPLVASGLKLKVAQP